MLNIWSCLHYFLAYRKKSLKHLICFFFFSEQSARGPSYPQGGPQRIYFILEGSEQGKGTCPLTLTVTIIIAAT